MRIPVDEFYNSTPRKIARRVPYYLQARNQAEKEKEDYINVQAWVNGLYVCRAMATMNKKRYPDNPVDIFESRDNDGADDAENSGSPSDGFRAWAIVYNDQRRRSMENGVINNASKH